MLKQIIRLWAVSSCNLFGMNQVRFSKDPKKKLQFLGLGVAFLLLVVMFEAYLILGLRAYFMMGLGDVVPLYCYTLASILIFMLTLLRAGGTIFQKQTYEFLVSLPVSVRAIVASRFLTMYTANLFLAAGVFLPGMVLYGIYQKPSLSVYILFFLGLMTAPFLAVTLATAMGGLTKAVSVKMKHKSIAESILMVILVVGIIVCSSSASYESLNEEMIRNLSQVIADRIGSLFPPAVWFSQAVLQESMIPMLLLMAGSVVLFTLVILLLSRWFTGICSALNASYSRNDFKMEALSQSSVTGALLKREFRYYFSQSTYLVNTIIGPVMMLICSIALCVAGPDSIQSAFPIENALYKYMPFILGVCVSIMPTTICSVSLEGKTRWLSQSLPIPIKAQYDGKLMMYYCLCAPFYLASVAVAAIGLKFTGWELVWLILVPAVMILFSGVWGLFINLLLPNFQWENEVRVVKQSAASMIGGLGGMLLMFLSLGLYVLLESILGTGAVALEMALLLVCTGAIYCKVSRMPAREA